MGGAEWTGRMPLTHLHRRHDCRVTQSRRARMDGSKTRTTGNATAALSSASLTEPEALLRPLKEQAEEMAELLCTLMRNPPVWGKLEKNAIEEEVLGAVNILFRKFCTDLRFELISTLTT